MTEPTTPHFTDPAAIARYAEGPRRNVPGYDSLLRMSRILLAERVPAHGRVLVVGAGGGLELEDMALAHPGWRFDGVDPSQPMLDLAAQRLESAGVPGDRVALHHGYVQSAPAGPFDGATCLLTFHFVPREERAAMVVEIRRRLKPGAVRLMAASMHARVWPASLPPPTPRPAVVRSSIAAGCWPAAVKANCFYSTAMAVNRGKPTLIISYPAPCCTLA